MGGLKLGLYVVAGGGRWSVAAAGRAVVCGPVAAAALWYAAGVFGLCNTDNTERCFDQRSVTGLRAQEPDVRFDVERADAG